MCSQLTELDSLLADLNSFRYCERVGGPVGNTDYYSDTESGLEDSLPPVTPRRPQKPSRRYHGSSRSQSPSPIRNISKMRNASSRSSAITITGNQKMSDRNMIPQSPQKTVTLMNGRIASDEEDIDYDYTSKWEYLGKGIWENQDYGTLSNFSTMKSTRDDLDYDTLSRSGIVSEEELEKETGAGPRGDRSRYIETDTGTVQSKYRYMGFGLWENLDPTAPKKVRKPKPPPPPPKAEPIWYNCTVSVSNTVNSKELDDLVTVNIFTSMETRDEWVSFGFGDLMADKQEPWSTLDKEDMSEQFSRAMLEKMQLTDDPRVKYKCYVCSKLIEGRVITAMGNKFHPACFVCTYCRCQFKERKYKTDPREGKPYCLECFEKLLGHFGNIHSASAHG